MTGGCVTGGEVVPTVTTTVAMVAGEDVDTPPGDVVLVDGFTVVFGEPGFNVVEVLGFTVVWVPPCEGGVVAPVSTLPALLSVKTESRHRPVPDGAGPTWSVPRPRTAS